MSSSMESADNFQSFMSDTTLHGARYIGNVRYHTIRRVTWTITTIMALTAFVTMFSLSLKDYAQYKSVVSDSVHRTHRHKFPAVTICNKNVLKRSSIESEYPNLLPSLIAGWSYLVDENDEDLSSILNDLEHYMFWDVFRTVAPNISDTFKQCKIGTDVIPCEEYIKAVYFERGICFIFNSYSYFKKHGEIYINGAGHLKGIDMILDVQANEYIFPTGYGIGMDIMVHDQAVFPLFEQTLFTASPGKVVNVAMEKTISSFLPKPYSETDCIDDTVKERSRLKHPDGYPYSEEGCLRECAVDFIYRECCNFFEFNNRTDDACTYSDTLICLSRNNPRQARGEMECDCLPTCEHTDYSLQITSSKFPNLRAVELARSLNWSVQDYDEMAENLLQVNFFFSEMKYTHTQQLPITTPWTLFSNIGGLLGLFLGASWLTIIEFLDFGFYLLFYKLKEGDFCRTKKDMKISGT